MQRFWLPALLIIIVLTALLGGTGYALASNGAIPAGTTLFPIQNFAEQQYIHLLSDPTMLANYELDLLARRNLDLKKLTGTTAELAAMVALNQSLDQAILAVGKVPASGLQGIKQRLATLLIQIDTVLAGLKTAPQANPTLYTEILTEIVALQNMVGGAEVNNVEMVSNLLATAMPAGTPAAPSPSTGTVDPQMVVFPPGSAGAEHKFFPLYGKHAELVCQDCHTNGIFANIGNTCVDCHVKIVPAAHFPGDCALCHTSNNWKEVSFDHTQAAAKDCQLCHTKDKPDNHYSGQCSACHIVRAWKPATFNHQAARATDCQYCHYDEQPRNHFPGQCSNCHRTSAWLPANFSHTGLTDCQNCHTSDRPANHYSGQCSRCHKTTGWLPATFNHSGFNDCQNCHSNDRPANHYSGQCSSCHSNRAWLPANFNHAGQNDCQSCHNRPSGHYNGQCSNCHNTNGWGGATFSHTGQNDCQSCHNRPSGHYGGQCSNCHNTNGWGGATFSHAGQTDCQSCHNRPSGHYDGQCSNCHNTNGWGGATFSHRGLNDCQSCHNAPSGHWNGQCSQCHNTNGWGFGGVDGHRFPMDHGSADGSCSNCHEGTNNNVNCYKCHNKGDTEKNHEDKGILDIAGRCMECHPDGEGD